MDARSWPLVGRAQELARIVGAIEGEAGGILLAGAAGVGKTRLAAECLVMGEQRGFATAQVRANPSSATIPYGAFAPLLPPSTKVPESRGDLLRFFAEAVLSHAGDRPLLLVVDDAQDLDEASAALLLQLVLQGGVFPVVTLRSGTTVPESVVMLWKDELVQRIDVTPLSPKDVAKLAAEVLGGPVDGNTVHALWTSSEGNALFLRELIVAGVETGALSDTHGIWRLRGSLASSPRLTEIVGMRLGSLDDDEHRALEIVSVGEPLDVSLLETLSSLDAIERLERRGLVDVENQDHRQQVRVAHPLYGEVLRSEMPAGRRERLFRRLADAMEQAGEPHPEDALRMAVWRLESGDTEHAGVLLAAARQATFAYDFRLSEKLARAAWEAGAGAEAAHLLGDTLDVLGDHEQAEEVLRAAEQQVTDDRDRAMVAIARVDNLFRGLGRLEESDAVARAAEAAVQDPGLRAEIVGQRAINALFVGDLPRAIALAEPALSGDFGTRAYVQAALAAGPALALAGRTEDALSVADRAFALRLELGDQVQMGGPGIYLVARSLALAEAGRLLEAEGTAQVGYDGAVEAQIVTGQGWFTVMLGRICLLEGRVQTAARWFREAAVLWGELVHAGVRWGYGGLAHALSLSGDLDGAEAALADLDAEGPTAVRMMDVDVERGRAWYTWQLGEHARAMSILRDAGSMGVDQGQYALAAGAFHDLARLGESTEAAEQLRAVAEHVDGRLMEARLAHATALAKTDADELDRACEAFEEIGAFLFAAEAANAAAGLHSRAGLKRRASASAQKAGSLAGRCEGARTPALVESDEPTALTRREREVATLAARGMSSREIAETLVVSTRTVENHLQRAYEKLGVRGRTGLTEALGASD